MTAPPVREMSTSAYRIATPGPEADGTLAWNATTVVVVRVRVGDGAAVGTGENDVTGTGWTYASPACAGVVRDVLADVVVERTADPAACWHAMRRRVRNLGRPGLVSCALSAVDIALWDAAARVLGISLARLLGRVSETADVYASGGFTTWDDDRLRRWVRTWTAERAVPRVKLKIGESRGTAVARDLERVRLTRDCADAGTEVYADANGAYSPGQARRVGQWLSDAGVVWFEEPVSSDDLVGLRRVRDAVSADVAAGEYGYHLPYFATMIGAEAVDCVQVDVTRCGGLTEWARIAGLAAAHGLDVSAHCAPNLSAHAAVTTPNFRHIEWFADHDRAESVLFDGVRDPTGGSVTPDPDSPGHGMTLKHPDAERYRVA